MSDEEMSSFVLLGCQKDMCHVESSGDDECEGGLYEIFDVSSE